MISIRFYYFSEMVDGQKKKSTVSPRPSSAASSPDQHGGTTARAPEKAPPVVKEVEIKTKERKSTPRSTSSKREAPDSTDLATKKKQFVADKNKKKLLADLNKRNTGRNGGGAFEDLFANLVVAPSSTSASTTCPDPTLWLS